MVQYKIQLIMEYEAGRELTRSVTAQAGISLLELCRAHGIFVEAACNGCGLCGKCRVRVVWGKTSVSQEERSFFTPQEIAAGWRLSCRVKVEDHLIVRINNGLQNGQEMQILTPVMDVLESGKPKKPGGTDGMECYIAADIGSTTLAAALLRPDGTVLSQITAVNSQRSYGADVISRMQASNAGKKEALQACICRDLEQMFGTLAASQKQTVHVTKIAAAANTVMMHLLRGWSCEKLSCAPFEPVSLEMECLAYEELFLPVSGCADSLVYLLPGISAFVGADITAGLYASGFWQMPAKETALFMDLGTNGELVLGSSAGFVSTAAAAGPAFEGGRLSCGVPGIPGAVCRVSYLYHRVRIQTIGQKKPCGICGTGALSAAAALLKEGKMDNDGLLAQELFETGMELAKRADGTSIRLTQADIRELQMAKAAIRAGIEVLSHRYAQLFEHNRPVFVSRVYLSGGFGYYLPAETAAAVGLIPPELEDRVEVCGNTSLKGAVLFLTNAACTEEFAKIRRNNRSVRLEQDADFKDLYIRQMRFPQQAV